MAILYIMLHAHQLSDAKRCEKQSSRLPLHPLRMKMPFSSESSLIEKGSRSRNDLIYLLIAFKTNKLEDRLNRLLSDMRFEGNNSQKYGVLLYLECLSELCLSQMLQIRSSSCHKLIPLVYNVFHEN